MSCERTTLIIVAHPDDEVLGCGGMIAQKALDEGISPVIFFLSSGLGARTDFFASRYQANSVTIKRQQTHAALKILGVKGNDIIWPYVDFPDNKFDSVPLLDIAKSVEEAIQHCNPAFIYTHSRHDLNVDHRLTYQSVITAARPWSSEVEEIYSFEVPSSTECNYPTQFSPNVFRCLSDDNMKKKQLALQEYKDEVCEYSHPRSVEGIEINAKHWGIKAGVDGYVEAFELVRMLK